MARTDDRRELFVIGVHTTAADPQFAYQVALCRAAAIASAGATPTCYLVDLSDDAALTRALVPAAAAAGDEENCFVRRWVEFTKKTPADGKEARCFALETVVRGVKLGSPGARVGLLRGCTSRLRDLMFDFMQVAGQDQAPRDLGLQPFFEGLENL